MFMALASLALDKPVRHDVAMTGEISLRGLVLPVGGIKEKVLAALRAGIRTVLLPARNRRDLDDIPEDARKLSSSGSTRSTTPCARPSPRSRRSRRCNWADCIGRGRRRRRCRRCTRARLPANRAVAAVRSTAGMITTIDAANLDGFAVAR